jgi:sterol desaturase/sphingolipid hydroxylase (fatty acid hydroxylase superfamily)
VKVRARPRRVLAGEPVAPPVRDHVQDACFLALHAIVVIPLMTLLSVGAATLIGGHAQWIELWPAQNWSGWLLVPLTIVAMDAANWLAHYADHRFTALWRFHALHHSQEELSVLTSFPFGPLGRVLVSPAYHRLHHAADIQDANLGVVLTIWDVLAGRARFPSRANRVGRTGLDGRPVPVEQDDPAVPPLRLMAGQLIEPFQALR